MDGHGQEVWDNGETKRTQVGGGGRAEGDMEGLRKRPEGHTGKSGKSAVFFFFHL